MWPRNRTENVGRRSGAGRSDRRRSSWMIRSCRPKAASSSRTDSSWRMMRQPISSQARSRAWSAALAEVAAVPPAVAGLDAEPGASARPGRRG